MAERYIYIGASKTVNVTVKKNGSVEDLSVYEGYGVVLFYEKDGTVIEQYSKNAVSGWNSTDIGTTSEASGIINLYVDEDVTTGARKEGRVMAQVKIQDTNTNFPSNQMRDWADPVYAFTFKAAANETTEDIGS